MLCDMCILQLREGTVELNRLTTTTASTAPKWGVLTSQEAVVESISCLQNELDLIGVWRIKKPRTKSFTWSQKSPLHMLRYVVLCCAMLCIVMLCWAMSCYTCMSSYVVLCLAMLGHVSLCCAMLRYVVLCCRMLRYNNNNNFIKVSYVFSNVVLIGDTVNK